MTGRLDPQDETDSKHGGLHTMPIEIRAASAADIPTLVRLMTAFYAESGFPLPAEPASRAFKALLGNPEFGGAWLAGSGGVAVGHAVLSMGFSMEYGGLRAVVDDLYVRPEMRGQGTGTRLLERLRADATARGARSLHAEVDAEDPHVRRLYLRQGYVESGHLLLTLPLAAPIHVV